jgi:hypothetical protein
LINQGPFTLALNVPQVLVDPAIGNGSVLLQVDNWSTFVLAVTAGPNATVWMNPFTCQTFPLASGSVVTVVPVINPSGATADQLGVTWLLQGEDAPNPNGPLTQPAVDISGTDITVTIDTSGGAVDIQSAAGTDVNTVSPSQVIQAPTLYSGTTFTATLAVGSNVHALGVAIAAHGNTGDQLDYTMQIVGSQTEAMLYQGHPLANLLPGTVGQIGSPPTFLIIPIDGALDSTIRVTMNSPSTADVTWAISGFTSSLPPYVPGGVPGETAEATASATVNNILPALSSGRQYLLWSAVCTSTKFGALVINGNSFPAGTILVGGLQGSSTAGGTSTVSFPVGLICSQVDCYDNSGGGGQTLGAVTYTYV